jgi:lysozyme family protein
MATVPFTEALRREYGRLFNTCIIRAERMQAVEQIIGKLQANRARYQNVSGALGIPWSFVAVIHNMEASLSFSRHLHNGDPLTNRTVHVPAGRPLKGDPPFTWEESACDALSMKGLGSQTDWSLAGTLYQLERYNGWGYRLYHPHVLSPYLWSFSNQYQTGKYVADGTWSDTAISRQCGAAVLLRRMAENGQIEFPDQPAPPPNNSPLVVPYSMKKPADPAVVIQVEELQRWLNTFPGLFVKVDGVPGKRTSEAYRKVTGIYLPGDPRG